MWQMHRPHRPQWVLTAAIVETETGLERDGDGPLLVRAEDLRLVLMGAGWIELRASSTTQ